MRTNLKPAELPREIPLDPVVPQPLRDDYISIQNAVELTGISKSTLTRHLRNETLAGLKMGPRLWYIKRETDEGVNPPGLNWWKPHRPGNPNWTNRPAGT